MQIAMSCLTFSATVEIVFKLDFSFPHLISVATAFEVYASFWSSCDKWMAFDWSAAKHLLITTSRNTFLQKVFTLGRITSSEIKLMEMRFLAAIAGQKSTEKSILLPDNLWKPYITFSYAVKRQMPSITNLCFSTLNLHVGSICILYFFNVENFGFHNFPHLSKE